MDTFVLLFNTSIYVSLRLKHLQVTHHGFNVTEHDKLVLL